MYAIIHIFLSVDAGRGVEVGGNEDENKIDWGWQCQFLVWLFCPCRIAPTVEFGKDIPSSAAIGSGRDGFGERYKLEFVPGDGRERENVSRFDSASSSIQYPHRRNVSVRDDSVYVHTEIMKLQRAMRVGCGNVDFATKSLLLRSAEMTVQISLCAKIRRRRAFGRVIDDVGRGGRAEAFGPPHHAESRSRST